MILDISSTRPSSVSRNMASYIAKARAKRPPRASTASSSRWAPDHTIRWKQNSRIWIVRSMSSVMLRKPVRPTKRPKRLPPWHSASDRKKRDFTVSKSLFYADCCLILCVCIQESLCVYFPFCHLSPRTSDDVPVCNTSKSQVGSFMSSLSSLPILASACSASQYPCFYVKLFNQKGR